MGFQSIWNKGTNEGTEQSAFNYTKYFSLTSSTQKLHYLRTPNAARHTANGGRQEPAMVSFTRRKIERHKHQAPNAATQPRPRTQLTNPL